MPSSPERDQLIKACSHVTLSVTKILAREVLGGHLPTKQQSDPCQDACDVADITAAADATAQAQKQAACS